MAAELAIIAKLQDEASSGIRALRGEVEGLEPSAGIAAQGFASLQTVGAAALTALAAAAVAVGGAIASSISVASEFEDSVTILSIAAKGAGESFDSMRAAAMAVGADTSLVGVNAAGAAEAMTILYKAGMTTGEVFGDLNGYLAGNVELSGALRAAIDGAAASELSMEQAAMLAATSLATFGGEMVTTEQRAQFVNDAMNNFVQTADASMASVADLAAAMSNIGPTAAQFGISLQDTNTALALLSTRGVMGAEAGTALKSMFNNLLTPTDEARAALNRLGVELYNADGTMRQLPAIVGDLSQALYGLNATTVVTGGRTAEQNHQLELAQRAYDQATDAIYKHNAGLKTLTDSQLQKYVDQQAAANAEIQRLGSITGTATTAMSQLTEEQRNYYIELLAGSYGMKAFSILLQEGADGWTAMEKAIASAATIQEVAAARTQTFSGAMEALSGVVETIRIGIGSAFLPVLTALARVLADLAAESLPYIVGAFEALGGALSMFFDAIMNGTPPIQAFVDAVAGLAEALGMPAEQVAILREQLAGFLTAVSNVIGPIIQAVTQFVSWKDVLIALGIAIASVIIPALISIVSAIAPIALTIGGVILAVATLRNAWEADFLGIRTAVEQLVQFFQPTIDRIREAITGLSDAAGPLREKVDGLKEAFGNLATALEPIVGFIGGIIAVITRFFGEVLAGLIANAQQILGGWITSLTGWVNTISAVIGGVVNVVSALLRGDWAGAWEAARSAVSGAADGIGQVLSGLASTVDGVVGAIWNAIVNLANDLLGTSLPSWETFKTRVLEVFNSIPTEITNSISNWTAAVGNVIQAIKDALTGEGEWSDVGTAIMEAIRASLETSITILSAIAGLIRDKIFEWAGAENWQQVGDAIAQKIGDALAAARDFVVGKLTEWQTAIFNWAGVEDWSGVAQHIAELIGTKLGELGSAIAGQLGEWQQAIFDWAGAEDWQGVAEHIAGLIGEKLGEAKDAIADQLGEWQQAIFDWAGEEDWQGVADHIAELIGEKLGEAKDAISEKLGEWQQAIFDWAGEEDWQGVADHIAELLGIALGEAKETLAAKLGEWRQAIWDWADTEDWQGVADHIAELVATGLSQSSDQVTADLGSWQQAMFDWAGTEDWAEVSAKMAELIGDGLADEVEKVTEKMSGWVGEFTAWVERTDFKQVGYDIMYKITDAFLDFKTTVETKIATWLTDLQTATQGYTWQEIGAYILMKIVEALTGKGGEGGGEGVNWDAAVGHWIYEIGQAIVRVRASLEQLGRDIVAGVATGISAAVDLVTGAFGGVISRILQEGEQEAGAQSPARAFMPLGNDITAGVAVGITQNVGAVISAIQQVAQAIELEGVRAFGEAMQAIAAGVAAALSAILDIGSFQGGSEGFGAAMQALVDMMAAMVAAVAQANTYTAEVLENLGTFVEAAEAINDLLVQTADVVDYIGRWRAPDIAAANGSIEMLVGFLAQMVQGIVSLNLEAMLILGELGDFLDAAAELPGLFMGVADIVSYLAAWRAPGLEPVIDNVHQLAGLLGALVTAVAGANTMGLGMLDILAAFIETATGIVALIAPLADAILDIANFPPGAELSVMQANIERMAGYLAQIVTAVAGANTMGLLSLEQLSAFVDVAADIVDLINPMAEAMFGIANFPQGTDVQVMAHNIETMAGYLRDLVAAIAESNSWGQLTLELLDTFVQVAGSIAELITPLAEAIWNIANFRSPDLFAFVGSVATLAGHLSTIVVWFYSGLNLSQAALEVLGQYVEVMGAIAEGMVTFIDAIEAIASFQPPDLFTFVGNIATLAGHLSTMVAWFYDGLNLSQAALDALGQYIEVMVSIGEGMVTFIDAIAAIAAFQPPDLFVFISAVATLASHLSTMVAWFYDGLNYSQAALEALGQYVEVIGDLVDLIADAIEALGLVAAYSGNTATLGPAVAAFAADLLLLVQTLATGFASASAAALAAILAAGEFADAVGDILDVVEDGVDALTALAGYIPNANLVPTAQQFAADLATVITTVVNALQLAGVLAGGAIVAAGELADGLGDVLGMVEDGVGALVELSNYVPNAGLVGLAQRFAADLATVITAVVNALVAAQLLASEAVVKAGELSDGLADILGVVAEGVEAIAALATYIPAAGIGEKAQQFAADLAAVITAIVNGLEQAQLLANEAVVRAGEMAADLGELLGVVATGVEAINAIAEYQSVRGLSEKVARFAADLIAVATTLTTSLTVAAEALGQEAMTAAAEFAADAAAILDAVDAALTTLVAIGEHQLANGLGVKIQAFSQQLIDITTFLALGLGSAAAQLGEQVIADAARFATDAATILGAVSSALTALVAIGEHQLATGLGAKIQAFSQALIDTTTYLALGLGSAAAQLGESVIADATTFAADATTILSAVGTALTAMTAIGQHELVNGLGAKIQAFAQQIIDVTIYLALGLGSAAAQLGESVIADALAFAAHATSIAQAVDTALQAIAAIAANEDAAGLGGRIQILGQALVDIATLLATSLAAAAQRVTPDIVAAATQFAVSVTALADSVRNAVVALGEIGSIATPDVAPKLAYVVASAQQIQTAFSSAGDIGQAVAYAAAFRANLQQLVTEIQAAVAALNQIAGTGTSGSVGAALANIAASLQNTQGQFAGAGSALANALITALAGGIGAGQGQVWGALEAVLGNSYASGLRAAALFGNVGKEIAEYIASGISSGQGQVVAAVVQVVGAAIAAGINEAKKAADIGRQLIQAALAEVNAGRGQLDSAGNSAGNAMIDGMVRAILAGKSRLVNAIKDAVSAAVAAAKAALGIASPSKVATELLANFMNTAARTVDNLRGNLADSMAAALSGAATAAAAGLSATRLSPQLAPAYSSPGAALAERVAAAPLGRTAGNWAGAGSGSNTQVVFYGNVVLPNVVDPRSFLEELDALRGAA